MTRRRATISSMSTPTLTLLFTCAIVAPSSSEQHNSDCVRGPTRRCLAPHAPAPPGLPPTPVRPEPSWYERIGALFHLGSGNSNSTAREAPGVATCEKWCHTIHHEQHEQHEHFCKCAACNVSSSGSSGSWNRTEVDTPARAPLEEGAPCRNGHATHAARTPLSSAIIF